jgi:hypothetical protein
MGYKKISEYIEKNKRYLASALLIPITALTFGCGKYSEPIQVDNYFKRAPLEQKLNEDEIKVIMFNRESQEEQKKQIENYKDAWGTYSGIGVEEDTRGIPTKIVKNPSKKQQSHLEMKILGTKPVSYAQANKKYDNSDRKYSHLDRYKPLIEYEVKYFNKKFNNFPGAGPLTSEIVLAVLQNETGCGFGYDKKFNLAFNKDPMQITDNPMTLNILVKKKELTYLIDDFSYLKGKNKRNMDYKTSIKSGIGWLVYKNAEFGIKNTSKKEMPYIKGWDNWFQSVKEYNGVDKKGRAINSLYPRRFFTNLTGIKEEYSRLKIADNR